jgi:hypothetical protein
MNWINKLFCGLLFEIKLGKWVNALGIYLAAKPAQMREICLGFISNLSGIRLMCFQVEKI